MGAIILVDDTPEVISVAGGQSANVRIMFELSPEAVSATCALEELRPATDCKTLYRQAKPLSNIFCMGCMMCASSLPLMQVMVSHNVLFLLILQALQEVLHSQDCQPIVLCP